LEFIGSVLRAVESHDTVISEKVNLNEYIPTLSGPAPALRSHQGKRALIDPEALRASINAAKKQRAAGSDSPRREKDYLISKRAQLEAEIQTQNKLQKELEGYKNELERRLADLQTRKRLGSRSHIGAEEFREPILSGESPLTLDDWKRKYEEMEKKYRFLTDALHKKGQITRVSAAKPRPIPPPHVHPVMTFDYVGIPAERGLVL
jgi:hypothetical protein